MLLERGADVNHYGGLYGYALSVACVSPPTDFNVHLDGHGEALQASSMQRKIGLVKMLLDHRANPDNQGGVSGTALHTAMAWGNTQAVHDLLCAGANPNLSNARLGSPLQIALDSRNEKFVCSLVVKEADINSLNPVMQQRVINIAEKNGVDEQVIVRLKRSAGNSRVYGSICSRMTPGTMPVLVSNARMDLARGSSFRRFSISVDCHRPPPSREQIERWRRQGFQ